MTLDVEDIHSVMHHKYKLFTVLDYARKFGNAAKEGLKRPTHRAAYYFKSKFLVSFTRTCHYSVGHTSNLTVTSCTGWHHRAYRRWGTGHKHLPQQQLTRALTPPWCLCQTDIQAGEPVSLERSDLEESQENSGKQDKKENGAPALVEVFASITELCSGNYSLFPLLWHNRIAVTYSVLCSCWDCYATLNSLLIRLCVIEVKSEGRRYRE